MRVALALEKVGLLVVNLDDLVERDDLLLFCVGNLRILEALLLEVQNAVALLELMV